MDAAIASTHRFGKKTNPVRVMMLPTIVLLATTLLGGLAFVALGKRGMDNLPLVLSFGGSFIIGMCFLHLVPEAFAATEHAGLFVIGGFLIQGVLEWMSQGLEHGHHHSHHHSDECHGPFRLGKLPWLALISLGLHSALESMPVVECHGHHDHHHGMFELEHLDFALLTGLVLHKFPVSMVLMAMMIDEHVPRRIAWMLLVCFGLTPLVGMGLNELLVHNLSPDQVEVLVPGLQGLVVGILLHIGTTVLFEAGEGHGFHRGKFVATCLGLAISAMAFA